MENTEETTNQPQAEETVQTAQPALTVNEEMRSHFYEMAKWAKFLGIVGFVITGLMVIGALAAGATMSALSKFGGGQLAALSGGAFTFVFMLYAVMIFYPSLLMYQYSSNAKTGVLYGEQFNLTHAIGKLKSLFKFWGIVTIIFISLYALIFILAIVGAASSMSNLNNL
jgi:hypothetical protein